MAEDVADALADRSVDAAVLSGKATYPVLGALDRVPVLADVCDATSIRRRSEIALASGFGKSAPIGAWASVRWVERQIERRAAHATFASERDRDALRWAGPSSIVPNGIDHAYWHRSSATLGCNSVVFAGKLDYPPNEDAALWLTTSIMPLVRQTIPDAELTLVGRAPTTRLYEAARRHGAVVTGEVPDVRPYLDDASVFAAPLRAASGIQNKVLDALSMAVPVVATPPAAGGLIRNGARPPLTVAGDESTFAAALVEHLRRAAIDPTPHLEGRTWVTERFDWGRSVASVDALLHAVREAGRPEVTRWRLSR